MNDINDLAAVSAQCLRSVEPDTTPDRSTAPDADADAARSLEREAPRQGDHPTTPPLELGGCLASHKNHSDLDALIASLAAGPASPAPPADPPGRATRSQRGKAKKRTPRRSPRRTPRGVALKPAPEIAQEPQDEQDGAGLAQTPSPPSAPLAALQAAPPAPPAQAPAPPADDWQYFIETYYDKPVEFTQDLLGVEPDEWQAKVMREVAAGKRRIAIRAGHGVGKTAFCSWLVIWFMVTRYPQKTVLTAPTAGQLFDALFAETKFWVRKLPPALLELFELKAESIELKSDPEGSFVSAKTSSADRPEAMAGVHSAHVLLICDEASAIAEAVYEAAAGSMSGFSACTILISNPTRNVGLFFMAFHALKDDWCCHHVSCIGSPRVSPDFVKQIEATYGRNSNQYRVRVLGEFALREDDVLLPAELVDAAFERDITGTPSEPILYGLDVARFGDDRTVLCKRQGNVILELKAWNGYDLMETTGRVLFEAKTDKPSEIMVDVIGMGAGVADALRAAGMNVRDVNVAESAALNPGMNKLRDELWFALRDFLYTRAVKLCRTEGLREELLAPTYGFAPQSGKLKVEAKDDIKKKIRRSPDLADAICLTFAGQAAVIGGRATPWVPGKALKRNIRGII